MGWLAWVATIDYNVVIMSVLSIRFKRARVYERLKAYAVQRQESASGLGEMLIDEGLRMSAHAGIVFRDGPTGRRAGLAAGPDVWEVAVSLKGLKGNLAARQARAAAELGLTVDQIRTASRYYGEFPEEIEQQIAHNEAEADRELAIWENERRLLTS